MAKAAFNKKVIFVSQLDLNLRKKLVKSYMEHFFSVALKVRLFGKYTRNTCKVLKYCAEGEWRRSAGPFV
jgi:hypothetical protein